MHYEALRAVLVWGASFAYLDLLRCPLIQIDRFDSGDVDTQVAVDAGTADTHEHPEVP